MPSGEGGETPTIEVFGPPTPENPWANPTARHPFNVFNDNAVVTVILFRTNPTVAVSTPLEENDPSDKLTPVELEIAKRVHVGEIKCELGAKVVIKP